MRVSILTIGNEILSGRIINTNASFIASKLYSLGFKVNHILTVADKATDIINALDYITADTDIVLTTGGLGPTSDDISKKVISNYFGRELIFKDEIAHYLKNKFGTTDFSESMKSQAMVPAGGEYFINKVGTAPGILVRSKNIMLFMLPGVPKEMKFLLEKEIIPYLTEHFDIEENIIFNLRTSTIPEIKIYNRIKELINKNDLKFVGFYPSYGVVDVRISGSKSEEGKLSKIRDLIKRELYDYIFEEGFRNLEEIIGERLRNKGAILSIAESITGGMIGGRITDVPGSSDYFSGGVVTYSNSSKIKILHVSEDTLEKYGAVSEETCSQMLSGVSTLFNTDCSIAVTGIAGPGGGTKKKPVGLVYIGVRAFDKSIIKRYNFSGNRNMIRERTVNYSIYLLLKLLEKAG